MRPSSQPLPRERVGIDPRDQAGKPMISRQAKRRLRRLWNYLQGIFITALAFVCAVAIHLSWQHLHDARVLPFRQVNFSGQFEKIKLVDLQQTVQQHLNGGFFVLDIPAMRQALQSLPWVDQVAIRRIWPDTLEIQLSEQKAVAHWGKAALLNERAELFSPPLATIPKNLPYLYGPIKDRNQAFTYYQQLQYQLTLIHVSVAKLWVDERQSWELLLTNGIKVILGQDDILQRCQRLVHLYPRIIRARAADVALIDLRYPNGLAIKWRALTATDEHALGGSRLK